MPQAICLLPRNGGKQLLNIALPVNLCIIYVFNAQVEVNQRLSACKSRCVKYNLLQPQLFSKPIASSNEERPAEDKESNQFAQLKQMFLQSDNTYAKMDALQAENAKLRAMVDALQSDLQAAENEIVDAQQELFDTVKT